jgi:hypothetical protein
VEKGVPRARWAAAMLKDYATVFMLFCLNIILQVIQYCDAG